MRNSLPFILSATAVVALCASLTVAFAGLDDGNGVDGAGANAPLVLAPAQPVAPPAPAAQPPSPRVAEPEATPQVPAPPRETEPRQPRNPEPTTERNAEPTTEPTTEQTPEPAIDQTPETTTEEPPETTTERRTPELGTADEDPRRRSPEPDRDRPPTQMQREVGRSMCARWGFPEERCDEAIQRQQGR